MEGLRLFPDDNLLDTRKVPSGLYVYASRYCAVARYDDLSRPDCTSVASRGRWVIILSKALLVSLYTVPCIKPPRMPSAGHIDEAVETPEPAGRASSESAPCRM
jgi:hypothetical protein